MKKRFNAYCNLVNFIKAKEFERNMSLNIFISGYQNKYRCVILSSKSLALSDTPLNFGYHCIIPLRIKNLLNIDINYFNVNFKGDIAVKLSP